MANWIGVEEVSRKYKVSEKRVLQWCEQREVGSSELGGYLMIDEDTLKQRLELKKRESISKVELETRSLEIIQNNHDRIFVLESLAKLTPIMKLLLGKMGEMISKEENKKLFLYLSSGGKVDDYAKEKGLTVIKVQNMLDSAILEIQRNTKAVEQYSQKRLLQKTGMKKQYNLKKMPKAYIKPRNIIAGEAPEKVARLLSTSVGDLELDAWTLRSLTTNRLDTLGDLLYYTKLNGFDGLLDLNRFGAGSLVKLKSLLLSMGVINDDEGSYLYDYINQA